MEEQLVITYNMKAFEEPQSQRHNANIEPAKSLIPHYDTWIRIPLNV
ncbi:hypothetical protein COLO4_21668 [Corchorus olitorius]|uniref:Uncharacterized protein n=1 Tax=Corchorus olitorius TaxID=93759 RepID=A0A1R3IRV8_9ROSI|nr:hypothetical protein COLO4_21668 [Corchorus olitorius]